MRPIGPFPAPRFCLFLWPAPHRIGIVARVGVQTIEPAKRRHRHKRRRTRAWAVGETWGAGVIPEPTEIERKLRRARIIGWTVAIILGMAATLIAIAITSRPFEPTPVEPREAGTWHPFKSMDY